MKILNRARGYFDSLSNVRALVSLKHPIIHVDGRQYHSILGTTLVGIVGSEWYGGTSVTEEIFVQIGQNDNPHRILVPLQNCSGFKPCEKVIKNENILVIED